MHRLAITAPHHRFLFSKKIRWALLCIGLFVLYSQLVSAGLTGVFRYSPEEKTFLDGGDPPIFDYATVTLLQPPDGLGTSADWSAVGRDVGISPFRYAAWAVVAPILGSAALLFASRTGRDWRPRTLLLLGSILGIAAAVLIKIHEWAHGSIGWAFTSGVITDRTLPYAPHPVYGYAELIGSFFLPIIVYVSIVLFIVILSIGSVARSAVAAFQKHRS
jgi:hypothetical protein